MIKVKCRTNLDDVGNEDWPTEMPAVPRVGDLIQSGTVYRKLYFQYLSDSGWTKVSKLR